MSLLKIGAEGGSIAPGILNLVTSFTPFSLPSALLGVNSCPRSGRSEGDEGTQTICGSHGKKYVHVGLLGCGAVWTCM